MMVNNIMFLRTTKIYQVTYKTKISWKTKLFYICSSCEYWRDEGYCGGNYEEYMRKNCRNTCGYCVEATGG